MVRVILLLLPLAGCGGNSKIAVLASTPRQITYDSGDRDDIGDLAKRAQVFCDTYDRDAQRSSDDDRGQMTFHCVDRPPSVAAQRPDAVVAQPRKIVEGDSPMYCVMFTSNNKVNAGGCFRTVGACEKFRAMDSTRSECIERAGAACFNSTDTVTGERRAICFPTIQQCDATLEGQRGSPDVTELSSQCGVYRQRKTE